MFTSKRATLIGTGLSALLLRLDRLAIGFALSLSIGALSAWAEAPAPLVKTTTIESENLGTTRAFFGEISSKQTVDFAFQVGGRIVEFLAPEGEVVQKGAVIARLDPVPFEIEVERAQLALEQSKRTLARYEKLLGGAISEAQVLDAQTDARMAEVALRNAKYALEQATLIAPFDAIVAARNVANFSTVAGGAQVVRLHDLSELRVDIEVPEVLMQQIGEAPDLALLASFPGSDEQYALEFREQNAETSDVGQTFRVTLALQQPTGRVLLPGASVVVHATLNSESTGFQIPLSAIATAPSGETSVLRVVENASGFALERLPVVLAVEPNGSISVRDGIQAGDEIVVGGVNGLSDGQSVRVFVANF